MKTEPETFSISDLERLRTSCWEGVRNYQARNFMRDKMKLQDRILIYHSSCKNVGIAGEAEVCRESYPDHFAWDKNSAYFDPKSSPENPRWFMVDVKWIKTYDEVIPLAQLKQQKSLSEMQILKKGNRLSITPLTSREFKTIQNLL